MAKTRTSGRPGAVPKRKRDEPRDAPDWRDETLSQLRTLIMRTDPSAIEEMKWKRPSNPEGVPVWSHEGMICVGNILKRAVRLTFPKGAQIEDPRRLFNTRMDSKTVRAVDFFEGVPIDVPALKAIVREAVRLNTDDAQKARGR